MSAEVTDADRATAKIAARKFPYSDRYLGKLEWVIAQALADQRAAADDELRARVVALADDLATHTVEPSNDWDAGFRAGLDLSARTLRRALDPPTESSAG